MPKIWLTSDLHFGHDREFIFKPRGFNNVNEHDETLIENWNSVVAGSDTVYILGDIMLNDNDKGIENFNRLSGFKYIILGNHDTSVRKALYREAHNVLSVQYATMMKYQNYSFYLSHYPTITGNFDDESLKKCVINLFGHTHQQENFYKDIPFMYHVGVDSHNNFPVDIETIIKDCKAKVSECKKML